MKKQNTIRLNNVLFPVWMLILLPAVWLIVIPGNFLIDSAVLLIALRCLHIEGRKEVYRKSILKIFCFGFLSDLLGSLFLFLSLLLEFPGSFGEWWRESIGNAVAGNPFENIFAFLYVLAGVLLAGVCIYLLNRRFSFRKTDLPAPVQKRLCLLLAIFTAPYLFFLPSALVYRSMF